MDICNVERFENASTAYKVGFFGMERWRQKKTSRLGKREEGGPSATSFIEQTTKTLHFMPSFWEIVLLSQQRNLLPDFTIEKNFSENLMQVIKNHVSR